jgi:hypothetical protein
VSPRDWIGVRESRALAPERLDLRSAAHPMILQHEAPFLAQQTLETPTKFQFWASIRISNHLLLFQPIKPC